MRQKRNVRFDQLKQLHATYKAGINNAEKTRENIVFTGYKITEKELPKFAEAYPMVDMADFETFLREFDAYKGHKGTAGTHEANVSLNTREKALALGVAEADIPQYIAYIEAMYAIRKDLKKIIDPKKGTVSIAIPEKKEKSVSA